MIWTTEKELKAWQKWNDDFVHDLLFGRGDKPAPVEEERFCWAYIIVDGEEVMAFVKHSDKSVARKTKDIYSMSEEEYDEFEFVRWLRPMDL